jgi:hypothetical protein
MFTSNDSEGLHDWMPCHFVSARSRKESTSTNRFLKHYLRCFDDVNGFFLQVPKNDAGELGKTVFSQRSELILGTGPWALDLDGFGTPLCRLQQVSSCMKASCK